MHVDFIEYKFLTWSFVVRYHMGLKRNVSIKNSMLVSATKFCMRRCRLKTVSQSNCRSIYADPQAYLGPYLKFLSKLCRCLINDLTIFAKKVPIIEAWNGHKHTLTWTFQSYIIATLFIKLKTKKPKTNYSYCFSKIFCTNGISFNDVNSLSSWYGLLLRTKPQITPIINCYRLATAIQPVITCSKLKIEILEQGVKYVQR